MVKDVLDESSFAASPGHAIPGKLGEAAFPGASQRNPSSPGFPA
jgi:hypothetical protein